MGVSSDEWSLRESRKIERRRSSVILVLKNRWEFTGYKVEWGGVGGKEQVFQTVCVRAERSKRHGAFRTWQKVRFGWKRAIC